MTTGRAVSAMLAVLAVAAAATLGGCSLLPTPSPAQGAPAATAAMFPFDSIDGVRLGPPPPMSPAGFHRLEVTARDTWRATHPGETVSGFELRSAAGTEIEASPLPSGGVLEFLMLIAVVDDGPHLLTLHCDPSTFPAIGSCS